MNRCFFLKLQRTLNTCITNTQSMGSAEEQNKQLIRHYFEAYDQQDPERIGQLVSNSNYSLHLSGMPTMDWNGTKQFYAAAWRAFPDLHHEIFAIVAEGDKVAVRYNII